MIGILIRKLEATNCKIEKNEKKTPSDTMVILLNEKEHFQSA